MSAVQYGQIEKTVYERVLAPIFFLFCVVREVTVVSVCITCVSNASHEKHGSRQMDLCYYV